ncbi:hypothetical protein CNEO4_1050042 [Clostridium neonatale]|nr:hypothetical protein CNEO4_1050042 [Clostridium neonatale]
MVYEFILFIYRLFYIKVTFYGLNFLFVYLYKYCVKFNALCYIYF